MKNDHKRQMKKPDNLVTERDIDPNFGLFTEASFPEALKHEDQLNAVEHAIPKEKASRKDLPSDHSLGSLETQYPANESYRKPPN